MNITIEEMVELQIINADLIDKAYFKGVADEQARKLPDNLFDALLLYAQSSETLVDYSKSSSKMDGCNWIQLKPTREGSKKVKAVEISFQENLKEIDYIGILNK
tara:strand:+ start:163 stop:474 length:312 start_codon:yes stop_codon:yes gene_type:complete